MIVVLFGANELSMRRRLQELKDEADGGTGMLMTNTAIVDGRDAKLHDVIGPCMAPPFLAPRRLVIVEHLLERFEPRFGQRAARGLGQWEALPDELARGIPWTTTLVFFGQPFLAEGRARTVSKSNPLVTRLEKLPDVVVEDFPELKGDGLRRYIREEAALRGIRMKAGASAGMFQSHEERPAETDPVELLANLLRGDTLRIATELDKLALYTRDSGHEVTVADVNRVSAGDREGDRFKFMDALLDGQLAQALTMLERLKAQGENLQGLLAGIFDSYRRQATIIELVEAGASEDEIGRAMGNAGKYDGLRRAAIARARRLGSTGLKRAFAVIVEADRTNKLGEVDEEVGFEIMIARLCALAPAPVGSTRR